MWDFISSSHVAMNPLYVCGFDRVGCIGCPLAGKHKREIEFSNYPKYKAMYIQTFERMLEERKRRGKMQEPWRIGSRGIDVFRWWMEDGNVPGQMEMEDYL